MSNSDSKYERLKEGKTVPAKPVGPLLHDPVHQRGRPVPVKPQPPKNPQPNPKE